MRAHHAGYYVFWYCWFNLVTLRTPIIGREIGTAFGYVSDAGPGRAGGASYAPATRSNCGGTRLLHQNVSLPFLKSPSSRVGLNHRY